jgi:hypothetical protein
MDEVEKRGDRIDVESEQASRLAVIPISARRL